MYTELMYGAVLQSYSKLNERYHRYVERHTDCVINLSFRSQTQAI